MTVVYVWKIGCAVLRGKLAIDSERLQVGFTHFDVSKGPIAGPTRAERDRDAVPPHELPALIDGLRQEMKEAAEALDFERAAVLRDRLRDLEEERLRLS